MKTIARLFLLCLVALGGQHPCFADSPEAGLLFYLSGDHEFVADYAAGDPKPTFLRDVRTIPDGAKGAGFECANTQLMAYKAPGNIYAERGTLSFQWRSRYKLGPTPFPIFRVGYADHSSWDMVWLRIDYNGRGGFDAFVTDINLARVRVSYVMPAFPKANEWVHLALAWDETRGIRFYVNGQLAAKQDSHSVLFAGLDQFGPHSRIISPMQVQSAYNFIRGGDIDEIRIYDRMLSDDNVASLARGVAPRQVPPLARDLNRPEWRAEWWLRYGWNRNGDLPAYLSTPQTSVRKVEIHEVYDLKRWWWKATDGIAKPPGLASITDRVCRAGTITFNFRIGIVIRFRVSQSPLPCPTSRGTTLRFPVLRGAGCIWTATPGSFSFSDREVKRKRFTVCQNRSRVRRSDSKTSNRKSRSGNCRLTRLRPIRTKRQHPTVLYAQDQR